MHCVLCTCVLTWLSAHYYNAPLWEIDSVLRVPVRVGALGRGGVGASLAPGLIGVPLFCVLFCRTISAYVGLMVCLPGSVVFWSLLSMRLPESVVS